MSISLTRILQQITGLNTFFQGPNASRNNGVVLEDSASVAWTTDGQGNIQATATGSSLPVATAAGQVPTSTAAGTTYTAQAPALGAMTLIQTQTLVAPAPTVTFSAIPQTFTHLMLIVSALDDTASSQVFTLNFNGDAGTNYAFCNTLNVNGTPGGSAASSSSSIQAGLEGGTAGGSQIFIPAYRVALGKSITGTANSFTAAGAALAAQYGGNWNSAAAVSSILLTAHSNFVTGSVFSLYGIS